jgi:predicted Zn-dependent protease
MKKLRESLEKNKSVKNFRIYKSETFSTSIGINGKVVGGAYNPIQSSASISGILQIEWSDEMVSFVNLTRTALNNPEGTIKQAKKIRIEDKYARKFTEPYSLKKPNQCDQGVEELALSKPDTLVDILEDALEFEKGLGIKKYEMQAESAFKRVEFANSKGLKLDAQFTNMELSSSWDMKLLYELSQRTLLDFDKYKSDIKFFANLFKILNKRTKLKVDSPKVIILPEYAWLFFDHYLFSNLDGSQVANNLSRFKREDFKSEKKQFANWVNLEVNPKSTLTPGAHDFTSEGVKVEKTQFIKNGKLKTPTLDLKHSQKLQLAPTVDIASPYITSISNKKTKKLQEFIEGCDNAILVPYFLGLHTQNRLTGDYSLPAPHAIYIRNGKLIGNVKAILVGNFFEDLRRDDIEFVKTDLYPTPGICYNPRVIIE